MEIGKAASIILYRMGPSGREVLLTRRSKVVRSFPGFWVFPGGKQDPEDLVMAEVLVGTLSGDGFIHQAEFQEAMAPEFAAMLHGQPRLECHDAWRPDEWNSLAVTALRELWEETGLALSRPVASPQDVLAVQEGLLSAGAALTSLLQGRSLMLDMRCVSVAGRITTPDLGPKIRRFDTAFFLAQAPEPLGRAFYSREIDDGAWMRPLDALQEFGPERLAIPTRYILRQLHNMWNKEGQLP